MAAQTGPRPAKESLAVLVLPRPLEDFTLGAHAQSLLTIPRVVAVEPRRAGRFWRVGDIAATRQARRLRFPGHPRVIVLYHPGQYPLARALDARYEAQLWYLYRAGDAETAELAELDQLACHRAAAAYDVTEPGALSEAERALRERLRELEIITHRPFVPGARIERR